MRDNEIDVLNNLTSVKALLFLLGRKGGRKEGNGKKGLKAVLYK